MNGPRVKKRLSRSIPLCEEEAKEEKMEGRLTRPPTQTARWGQSRNANKIFYVRLEMRRLQIYIYTSFSNDVGISIATFGPHNKKVKWLYDVVKSRSIHHLWYGVDGAPYTAPLSNCPMRTIIIWRPHWESEEAPLPTDAHIFMEVSWIFWCVGG